MKHDFQPNNYSQQLRRKLTDLNEIWNTVSQMLEADPGRFWARSAQYSSDTLKGSRIFFGPVNKARFRRFVVGKKICDIST